MNFRIFLWILSLAILSVGARNFETGMTIDGPLYASIARRIAETGEYFFLYGGMPDFIPFAEHPHLAFWIQSLFLEFLPAEDWAVRVMGHLLYLLTLCLSFSFAKHFYNARVATWSVILLWAFPVFSNFYSTFYIDPSCIAAGYLFALLYAKSLHAEKLRWVFASVAGLFLGFSFMSKGLTALAFGPVAALSFFWKIRSKVWLTRSLLSLVTLGVCSSVLSLYYWGIQQSSVPDFLDIYWQRQMSNRFSNAYTLENFFRLEFWSRLLKDTHYLVLLLPFAFWKLKNDTGRWFLATIVCTFILMYAPARRVGVQYWIPLFPPIAIFIATLAQRLRFSIRSLQVFTGRFSLAAVLLLQYLPFPTHRIYNSATAHDLKVLHERGVIDSALLVSSKDTLNFAGRGTLAWYANINVHYLPEEAFSNSRATSSSVKGKFRAPVYLEETPPDGFGRMALYWHPKEKEHELDAPLSLYIPDPINNNKELQFCLYHTYLRERSWLYLPKGETDLSLQCD